MFKTVHSHHLGWSAATQPAMEAAPGDVVELSLQDASGNRVNKDDGHDKVTTLKPENANPLTGPVHIDGARPGDVLMVDILDYDVSNWGWTALIPGFGLLADQFPAPYLHISEYDDEGVRFTPDIILPVSPFAGTIGTCPAGTASQTRSAIPPHACGGNMDIPALRAGSRLYFPVQVPGALFSAGDGHAAQGDGEVCGTAVETRLNLRVKFSLLRDHSLSAPRARIPLAPRGGQALMTTGIGEDLWQCCRDALRFMMDELEREYRLSPQLAYCLCSCAADLKVAQAVNAPNWTVTCTLPLDCFRRPG